MHSRLGAQRYAAHSTRPCTQQVGAYETAIRDVAEGRPQPAKQRLEGLLREPLLRQIGKERGTNAAKGAAARRPLGLLRFACVALACRVAAHRGSGSSKAAGVDLTATTNTNLSPIKP